MRAFWMLAALILLDDAHSASVEWRACSTEGPSAAFRCGELLVPEDHARPGGRRIKVHLVVVPAIDPDPKQAPLYDLAGGPGISAAAGADFYATDGARYRQHRDVVLVDQRGTGESSPLRCPELELAAPLARMYPLDAVKRCRATLATHADLSKYTTQQSVADLETVRVALGHERVDLFGLSYGTRLALAWIERAPTRVRSAVLAGVAPADAKLPLWHARNAQATLDQVIADCEADATCRAEYPDLRASWAAVLASARFTGPAREAFRTLLISPTGQRGIPKLVDAMGSGDFSAFEARFAGRNSAMIAEGLYLSVVCTEDTQAITPAESSAAVEGTFVGSYRVDEQLGACTEWKVPSAPLGYGKVKHQVPVLMVAGDRDYVTPAAWAEKSIEAFPRGQLVTIPKLGHMFDGISNFECLDEMMGSFFEAPDDKLDTSCVAKIAPPPFEMRTAAPKPAR